MKNINWQVRIKNKNFWITFIPAVLVMAQVIAALFGISIDLGEIGNRLIDVINAVFVVLALLGVVNDPTTAGLGDSKQAMTYVKPKKEGEVDE